MIYTGTRAFGHCDMFSSKKQLKRQELEKKLIQEQESSDRAEESLETKDLEHIGHGDTPSLDHCKYRLFQDFLPIIAPFLIFQDSLYEPL